MGRRRENKKQKQRQAFVTWFLVGLMIFSLAGVFLGSTTTDSGPTGLSLDYEEHKFKVVGQYYATEVNGVEKSFVFHPLDVLTNNIPADAVEVFRNSPVITLIFDPDSEDIETIEMAKFQLENNANKIIYPAITKESEVYDYEIKNCNSASITAPAIYLVSNNESSTTHVNGCLTIQGDALTLLKSTEKIIYQLLGVVNG